VARDLLDARLASAVTGCDEGFGRGRLGRRPDRVAGPDARTSTGCPV